MHRFGIRLHEMFTALTLAKPVCFFPFFGNTVTIEKIFLPNVQQVIPSSFVHGLKTRQHNNYSIVPADKAFQNASVFSPIASVLFIAKSNPYFIIQTNHLYEPKHYVKSFPLSRTICYY